MHFWFFIYSINTKLKNSLLANILKCIHLSIAGNHGYLSFELLFSHSRVICLIQLFVYQILYTCFHLSFFPLLYIVFVFYCIFLFWLFCYFFQFKQPLLYHWMWVSEQVWMKGYIFFKTVLHLAKMILGG